MTTQVRARLRSRNIQGVRQSTTILTPHLFPAFLEISGSYLVCSKYRWLGLITCTYFGVWCSNSYEQTGLSYTDLENALFFTSAKFLWKIWFILYKCHFEPGTGKTAHIWWFKFEWHHYSFVFLADSSPSRAPDIDFWQKFCLIGMQSEGLQKLSFWPCSNFPRYFLNHTETNLNNLYM